MGHLDCYVHGLHTSNYFKSRHQTDESSVIIGTSAFRSVLMKQSDIISKYRIWKAFAHYFTS